MKSKEVVQALKDVGDTLVATRHESRQSVNSLGKLNRAHKKRTGDNLSVSVKRVRKSEEYMRERTKKRLSAGVVGAFAFLEAQGSTYMKPHEIHTVDTEDTDLTQGPHYDFVLMKCIWTRSRRTQYGTKFTV